MARKKLSRKGISILLLLALLLWRAWPLIPIIFSLNLRVSHEEHLIEELLPPSEEPTQILKGLSHPYFNERTLISEILFGRRNITHGHAFHPREVEPLPEHSKLASLLSDRSSYWRWRGQKACGGFHGDYLLTWETDTNLWEAILCNGCGEVILYHGDQAVRCDLTNSAQKRGDSLHYRIKGRSPYNAQESMTRLLLSVELLNEQHAIKEDPQLLVKELDVQDATEFAKLIKSHSLETVDDTPATKELFKKHLHATLTHLSNIDRRAVSLINLMIDPDINWSDSEFLHLQNIIVRYGYRAIRTLKSAPADHPAVQQCLLRIREQQASQ